MTAQFYQGFYCTGVPTAAATETAEIFSFKLGEVSGSNNTYILCVTYQTGTVPTISDTYGNTWPAPTTVTSGGMDTAIWVVQGISVTTARNSINIDFGARRVQTPSIDFDEWSGLATSGGLNGHVSTSAEVSTAGVLTTGSFTPTNNNANGGNLLRAYFHDAGGNEAGPTGWVAGTSFALQQGDTFINGNQNQGLPMASEYFVQATSAAINPSITATGDTTTAYNCIAIALPLAAAGTPPPNSMRIAKIIRQRTANMGTATSAKTNLPTVGNLRLWIADQDHRQVSAIVDTDGSYTDVFPGTPGDGFPVNFYQKNAPADAANVATFTFNGSSVNVGFTFYDIANAPTGTVIGATATATVSTTATQTSVSSEPNITPQSANSKIFTCLSNGLGPTIAITSPSGARMSNLVLDNGGATANTNATTASGNNTLHFASVPAGLVNGMLIFNNSNTASTSIPSGATITGQTSTTVTMSANAGTSGVASGASISFVSEQDSGVQDGGGWGILDNTSTSAENWTWTVIPPSGTGGTTVLTTAVEILAPAAAAAKGGTMPLMGVG